MHQMVTFVTTSALSSNGQHERGHLKSARGKRAASYIVRTRRTAQKKRYSEAAKPLKRCYPSSTPALDLATPASARVAPSGTSVDRKIINHCVSVPVV